MITISPETWDLIKIAVGAYMVYCLNKNNSTQREIYNRLRAIEIACAKNHGKAPKEDRDENC